MSSIPSATDSALFSSLALGVRRGSLSAAALVRLAVFTGFVGLGAASARAQGVIHTFPGTLPFEFRPTVAAGDVDGDGIEDVFVASVTGVESVEVRSGATGAVLHVFSGSQSNGDGPGLSGRVDLDGDGFSDLVIGDPERAGFYPHPSAGGTVRAISGATGAVLWTRSGAPLDALGGAVSAGPDVDQDGFPDVAAGADQLTLTGAMPGYAVVWSGATGATLFTHVGQAPGGRSGAEVALTPDVDGDAAPDLVVVLRHPAPSLAWAGALEVVSPATGAVLWSATGANPGDGVGTGAFSPGDLDGDARADVVFSAPGSDAGGVDAGVLRARRGDLGTPVWTVFGAAGDLLAGGRLHGDVDGDAVEDLLVRRASGPLASELRLHSGASGAFHLSFGTEVVAGFGGVGDVNGDGFADVGVGAVDSAGTFVTNVEIRSPVCGPVALVAIGCPGAAFSPTLAVGGCPVAGGTVTLALSGGPPHAPALLVVGAPSPPTPLPSGCVLAVALPAALVPLALDASGALALTATLPIPLLAGTVGVQALIADAGVAGGVVASEAWALAVP